MAEADEMKSSELINIIRELRKKGWTDTEILNHILVVEGDKPEEADEAS